jgi:hypothetical protein
LHLGERTSQRVPSRAWDPLPDDGWTSGDPTRFPQETDALTSRFAAGTRAEGAVYLQHPVRLPVRTDRSRFHQDVHSPHPAAPRDNAYRPTKWAMDFLRATSCNRRPRWRAIVRFLRHCEGEAADCHPDDRRVRTVHAPAPRWVFCPARLSSRADGAHFVPRRVRVPGCPEPPWGMTVNTSVRRPDSLNSGAPHAHAVAADCCGALRAAVPTEPTSCAP